MEFYTKLRDKDRALDDKIQLIRTNTHFIPNLHEMVVDFLVTELSQHPDIPTLWQMLRSSLDAHPITANIIRLVKKSNLINPISVVFKQNNEDALENVARILDLTIGHYNKDSVLNSYSIYLNSATYPPINDIFIRFIRLNKFNKKSLSGFVLENIDKFITNYSFTSLLITQTDTIRSIQWASDMDDFLIYHLTQHYDKDLIEHFIRTSTSHHLISSLLQLNQSKAVPLSEDLLQHLTHQSIELRSPTILNALWTIEPDHMFAHIDASIRIGLADDVDRILQEKLLFIIITVYSDTRSLPTLTESLISALSSNKHIHMHSTIDYALMNAYQIYTTSEQVEQLCNYFGDRLRGTYGIEPSIKKRKSEGNGKSVINPDVSFTATAAIAELFFMALPKLLTSVTAGVGDDLRTQVQKLAEDISPQYTISDASKEYRSVRLMRCLAINQIITLPQVFNAMIDAFEAAAKNDDDSLASEYAQMAFFTLSHKVVDGDVARRFLDVSTSVALHSSKVGEKVLGCVVRHLYVLEHYARDEHLDAFIEFICRGEDIYTSSQAVAVEEILTSALFWELSRFRSRLTTHVESTLKSGDQRIQAHTLTLLLRFPRGSYTSKFVRNLAIDTAIALESVAEKVSTYITLRRLLLALIGDNAKVGAKNEEYAVYLATSSTWNTSGDEKALNELNKVSIQLLDMLARPIIRTDCAQLFKKLHKKFDKGVLSMMAASCVLEVYLAHHKPSQESEKSATMTTTTTTTTEDDNKYVYKLTQAMVNKLCSELVYHTTVANISALVSCLRMSMIRGGGAVDAKCLDIAKSVTLTRVHSTTPNAQVDSATSVLHFLSAGLVRNVEQIDVAAASWCIYHERASTEMKSVIGRGLAEVVVMFLGDNNNNDVDVVGNLWEVFHSHIREPTSPLLAALDGLRVVVKSCREGGNGRFIRRRLSGLLIDLANAAAVYKHLPTTLGGIIELLESIVHERAILLQSTDVGSILIALTNAVSASKGTVENEADSAKAQALYDRVNSTLLQLIRLRRDICASHAPSLALLLSGLIGLPLTLRPNLGGGAIRAHLAHRPSWLPSEMALNPKSLTRLLEGLTTKTVPLTTQHQQQVTSNSLKEAFARHAYIVLHTFARSATSPHSFYPQSTRHSLMAGLYALCECVDLHKEQEFMLSGITDDGARSVVKVLWKDYDEQRYVGLS
ncbi:hypothetical protein E3P77_01852 [Wallemia ichthyophaga]|nr:hypothetical protein E3P77_01852 [Wallemia ichthyophaga]